MERLLCDKFHHKQLAITALQFPRRFPLSSQCFLGGGGGEGVGQGEHQKYIGYSKTIRGSYSSSRHAFTTCDTHNRLQPHVTSKNLLVAIINEP